MGLTNFLLGRRLVDAASEGEAKRVESLLKDGAHVDSVKNGETALVAATKAGHAKIVTILLSHGADTSQSDANFWTPLMYACHKRYMDIAEQLLQAGSNPNQSDQEGFSCLMAAAEGGLVEIVRKLVENGADCNATNAEGWTALMFASREGRDDVVKALLEHGAETDPPRETDVTALILAVYGGHNQVVKTLAEHGADLEAVGPDELTPILVAYYQGHQAVVNTLAEYGAALPEFPPVPSCSARSSETFVENEIDEDTGPKIGHLVRLDLHDMASRASKDYSNQVVSQVNDHVARLAVSRRDFHWHSHEESDELFLVIDGTLMVDLEDRTETLTSGQMITVPKKVRHRTRPHGKSVTLCFERDDTDIMGDS